MTRAVHGRLELRRRAVVAGRARDADGRPLDDPTALMLRAAPPDAAPDAWRRAFACHLRADGTFFFLDVPEGRYLLTQTDARGRMLRSREVRVSAPAPAPGGRWPVARVDFETADPRPAGIP
jgi:hypothetical protein